MKKEFATICVRGSVTCSPEDDHTRISWEDSNVIGSIISLAMSLPIDTPNRAEKLKILSEWEDELYAK